MGQTMAEATAAERRLFRVELHLLTYMWNEGFEKADQPWLQLYTDNGDWARGLPPEYSVPNPGSPMDQELRVQVDELAADWQPPTQAELDREDWDLEEDDRSSPRFFALTFGLSNRELDAILQQRLSEWDGI